MQLYEMGKKIKSLRESQKLTQQELAQAAGISRVTLGKLEHGELGATSVKTLDLILVSLGYEIEFQRRKSFGLPSLDQLGDV